MLKEFNVEKYIGGVPLCKERRTERLHNLNIVLVPLFHALKLFIKESFEQSTEDQNSII